MTDLIGVDVADPGDEGLVEQKRLQRAMSLPEPSPELAEVEAVAQRIGPEPRELRYLPVDISGIEHHHLAEGSGIDEEHPATVVDKRVDMGVGGRLIGSVDQQHLSAHPEVDHDRPAGVEGEREVLAASVDIHHPGSGHPLDQRRPRGSSHHPLSSDRHRDETAAGEALGQAPTDHLDLGGLGHALAVESVEGGEGRGLLRVLLGATGADSEHRPVAEHLRGEDLVVVRPGRRGPVLGRHPALRRQPLLERRLPVETVESTQGALKARSHMGDHHGARRLHAAVEVDRAEHRLEGVGQDGVLIATSGGPLTAAEVDVLSETERTRDLGEGALVDHRLAQVGEGPLGEIGEPLEDQIGDHETEDGIAEELETLVALGIGLFSDPGAMAEGAPQQSNVVEPMPEGVLEGGEVRRPGDHRGQEVARSCT